MLINNLTDDLKLRSDYDQSKSRIPTDVYYQEAEDELLASLFVNHNDDRAFNEIVKRYGDKIFRLALRITRNEESAEEILQNVFIKLIEKLDTFRKESKLSTWIYSVSSNESFMYLRNRNKSSSREISVEEIKNNENDESYGVFQNNDHHSRPDNVILENEQRSMLENAINELPEEYRVVFQLRDIEGLSNNEVADILGLTIPAVKSRILRSRNQLRKKLINYFPEYQS